MRQRSRIPAMDAIRRLVTLTAAGTLLFSIAGCGGGRSNLAASPTAALPAAASDASAWAGAGAQAEARAESEARIAFLEQRAEEDPLDVFSLNELAIEHLQRARETGDVASLTRAQNAIARSLERKPDGNYEAAALGAHLAVTQHDFAVGLALAEQAIALTPRAAYAYGVAGDALVGLGRYDEAARSYATMHDIEPSLSSEGRLAFLAQLNGEHEQAMTHWNAALDLAQGDGVAEHEAWVQAQIAALRFIDGDLVEAQARYEQSQAIFPGYVHALAGLGRVAAARGDLNTAISRYEEAIAVVPLPEYVIALGDVYAAAGDSERADDQYELVAAIEQIYEANGVSLDVQIVLFNADHGRDLPATVDRAEATFAAQQGIYAADALAWARYKSGDIAGAREAAEQAMRTGSRDPLLLFHAGVIFGAAGEGETAASYLRQLRDQNPRFSVLHAEEARRALDDLELAAGQ